MARKKVKLEWITNDAARRATFKKRRKGLMKKVSELSTLCDVKACLIVYGPSEPSPEVWPSVPEAVRVLAKLKRMPEMEQSKKMMNQEGFMRQRIAKLQDQLRKQDRENRELETTLLMYESLVGAKRWETAGIEDVTSLAWLVEMKVNEVRKRIEGYKGGGGGAAGDGVPKEAAAAAAAQGVKEEVKVEEGVGVGGKEKSPMEVAMEELQRQEWFTDIMNPPHEHLVWGGGDNPMVMGMGGYPNYVDHVTNFSNTNNNGGNNPWLDAYFPLN